MTRLIGLGGYATAGKDAVADFLVTDHGFMKMGMSDALLDVMTILNPYLTSVSFPDTHPPVRFVDHLEVVGYVEAKRHPEVRRLMQILGTEIGRNMLGPDTWADMARNKILAELDHGRSVAITGIRFPNEIDMIHSLGGALVWVDRPGVEPARGHASDQSVSPEAFDVSLLNHGTLDDLQESTTEILRTLSRLLGSWPARRVPTADDLYQGPIGTTLF